MIIMFLKDHFRDSGATGILLIIFLFCQEALGQNLVINGNFESGNQVGFSSDYTFIPNPTGTTLAGQYGIGNNPQPFNTASFSDMGDHTSGRGNMMIVDGTNNGGNTEPFFWKINNNGEICGLTIGETYTFSYWVKSVYRNDIFGATSADIGIKWNNVQGQSPLGIIIPATGSMIVLPPSGDWQQVTYHFVPTNSCVRIEMFDRNGNLAGNDFAIDDIELLPPLKPLQLSYALIPSSCPDANDGFIAAYGRGGKEPYIYSFNGRPFSSTLLLTGLGAVSRQFISLRDGNAPPTEVSVSDISLPAQVNPLDAGPNGIVCAGRVYQLNASGGSSYSWTATPEDTSLTTPNIANPLVKPLVNTLYQVTSQVNMVRNLIFNGDFSEGSSGGNVGFGSDYFHRHANPDGFQGIYAIVSNAQTFYTDLPACTGTGGTGDQMFVADGSTAPNARVWWQEVPVQPNTSYTFTYYLQSVHSASPALIETNINNQPITGNAVTSTQTAPNATCAWQKVTYSWNSGANTSALICLFNRNLTAVGNDFALDNISFSTNMVCTFTRQVAVNVTTEEAPAASVTIQPTCSNPTGTIVVTAPDNINISYSLDGINWQTNKTFTGVIPNTYNLRYRLLTTGCISSFTQLVVNAPPGAPSAPVANIKEQTGCTVSTGTIEVTSPIGNGLEYSIDGSIFQTGTTFSGLNPGTYRVVVKNQGSQCFSGGNSLIINPVPVIPAMPSASVTVQPSCSISTGTIVITSPTGPLLDYTVDGVNFRVGTVFTGLAPGNYAARVRHNTHGCISSAVPLVILPSQQSPSAPGVATPVTHCQFTSGIQSLTANGTSLKWYRESNGGAGATIAPLPDVTVAGTTNWYVSQTNALGCESPRAVITVNVVPVPVITVPDKVIEIQSGQSVTLPASVSGQGVTIRWTPSAGLSDPLIEKPVAVPGQTTTYTILASTAQACSASDTIRVVVFNDIMVPNVFSPNGDGINDKWIISYLESYPDATLEVFDRYGKAVYRSKSAAMPWDGTTGGKQVPAGTYYYILKPGNNKVLNGSVTVLR